MILTLNEYVHFNHLDEYGFDDEDGINETEKNLQQDNFIHNDDIDLEHDRDEVNVRVNAPVEVPILLEGFAMTNVPNILEGFATVGKYLMHLTC